MSLKSHLQRWVVASTCFAMTAPPLAFAQEPMPQRTQAAQAAATANDVRLDSNGRLIGQVVTTEGRAAAGIEVQAWKQGKMAGRTVSNERGVFVLPGLTGGLHQLMTESGGGVFRVWPANSAPPIAKPNALLIQGAVVRGQIHHGTPHNRGQHPFPGQMRGQNGMGNGLFGGAFMNTLANPWVVSGLLATGVAVPIAASNSDDENGS